MKSRTIGIMLVLTCVLLAGGLQAGCGDDDGGSSIPLEQVENQYLHAYCAKLIECPTFWATALFDDTQDCVDNIHLLSEDLANMFSYFEESVNADRMSYNGKKAAECLTALETLSCDEFYNSVNAMDACELTFLGRLDDGEGCRADEECAGGWCDTRDTCPGVCATVVAESGSCAEGQQCASGLRCMENVCEVDPGPLGQGESCLDTLMSCAYGLYCDGESGKCAAQKGEGQSCGGDSHCQADMMCLNETCTTVTIVDEVGEECDPQNLAKICDPLQGLVCQMDISEGQQWTTCVEGTHEGDTCVDTETMLVTPCASLSDIYCDYSGSRKCVPKKEGGQPCEESEECLSGWCMSGECVTMEEEDECF